MVEVLVAKKADIQSKDDVSPPSPLACPGVPLCVVWRSPRAPCDGGGGDKGGEEGGKTLMYGCEGQ